MLFKWIILAILAWYIFRAAGNLIAAAKGERPRTGSTRQKPGIRLCADKSAARFRRASDTCRQETFSRYDLSPSPPSSDVEDARFTDL